jgi:hypothetical protein
MHMLINMFQKRDQSFKTLTKSVKNGSDLCILSTTLCKLLKKIKLIETRFVIFSNTEW